MPRPHNVNKFTKLRSKPKVTRGTYAEARRIFNSLEVDLRTLIREYCVERRHQQGSRYYKTDLEMSTKLLEKYIVNHFASFYCETYKLEGERLVYESLDDELVEEMNARLLYHPLSIELMIFQYIYRIDQKLGEEYSERLWEMHRFLSWNDHIPIDLESSKSIAEDLNELNPIEMMKISLMWK